jgi:hypothetical protein
LFKWIKSAKKIFSGLTSDRALVRIDDDGFMSENIAVSIEDIITQEDNEDIGKVHVLSLTEFHQAMGDTWDAREAKIFLLTESVLRQMVGTGNRWEHQSKEIYIMLFPTLSEIEADARAYDIAEQLGLKIIGERFDGTRRPFIRVAGVDPKDALTEDGKLDIEKLEAAGRAGDSAGEETAKKAAQKANRKEGDLGPEWDKNSWIHGDNPAEWEEEARQHETYNSDWKKNEHQSQEHDSDWHKQQHAHTDTNTDWKEKHMRRSAPQNDPRWKTLEREKKEIDAGPQWVSMDEKAAPQETSQHVQPTAKPRYTISFSPCWERNAQSLNTYKSLLNLQMPTGEKIEGPKAYGSKKTAAQIFKIDVWLLQQTAKSLFPFLSKDVKTPVFIPIHSSTLRGNLTDQFFAEITKFTAKLRQEYFIIEILDDGTWTLEDLSNCVARIKETCFGVAFSPSAENDFKATLCPELDWVGIDLTTLNETSGISPERLETLHSEIQAIGAQTYIFGITQRAQLSDLIEMGAGLVSGAALVKNTDKLRPPFALAEERLKKS